MKASKLIIGLCGGIGAGKSAVAAELADRGCVVIDSDQLNHEVLERPEVVAALVSWWGNAVRKPSGDINRERVAEIIFGNAGERQRLEELLHPLIAELRADKIRRVADDSDVKAIVLDSPLLFESQLDRLCDSIIFVDASAEVRLARLQAGRKWDEAQLRRREQWQIPPEIKRSRADFVIDNNGTRDQLQTRVAAILHELEGGRRKSH